MKNILTLGELKAVIEKLQNAKVPTSKQLRESGAAIVAQQSFEDGSKLAVYQNGFALYETYRHRIVLRVEDCGDYTYFTRTGPEFLTAGYFDLQPWTVRLLLAAEDQIVHNQKARSEKDGIHIDWYENEVSPFDFVDDLLQKELLHELFLQLTKRQRQVMSMYYLEGFNQPQIAKMLHISNSAVTQNLSAAKSRLQEYMKNSI